MSIRKLASVQKIAEIRPIEGADAIEAARINGWWVVVKKQEFKVGDLCIYIEVDSWVPTELAPFLSKGQPPREYEGVKGERLRTVRLRKQISQGLILPTTSWIDNHCAEGDDLTEYLNIKKYEPPVPACLAGVVKGPFPSSIPKTDEERIQNLAVEWPLIRLLHVEVTEKLEGSSMTVALLDYDFIVCSRNLNLRESEGNTFWKVARQLEIEEKMRAMNLNNYAIQGELVGEGVEGNHYGIKGHRMYVYTIYDITRGEYVDPARRLMMIDELGLSHVPVLGTFPMSVIGDGFGMSPIENVLKYADGDSLVNPDKLREGVVFKSIDSQEHFKAVSNDYLLKHGG